MPCDLFRGPTCARTPLWCTTQILLPTNRRSTSARTSTGREMTIMVQTFAHVQQFFRPGAKGNTFAHIPEEPRCEAACVLCQRKDFIEHRPTGCLPRARPQTCVAPHNSPNTHAKVVTRALLLFKACRGCIAAILEKRNGDQRGWTPG